MSEEHRILVALGEPAVLGGVPTVILGLTDESWSDIDGGKAQDITLVPLGIYAQLLIMRGKDHADVIRQLRETAKALDIPEGDLADLSVPKSKRS
jgi:hypothetical protein